MLEKIRRCKYCRREMMDVSPLSWSENPYCINCFKQRISEASKKIPPQQWHLEGHYVVPKAAKTEKVSPK
jgi:hypothetical protein